MRTTDQDGHRTGLALLSLALGAFAIGVTEFTPMGMLPLIATGLHVSIPRAGLLISAYAIGVLVGAPLMTLLFARAPRRALLVGLMALFTLGNGLAAVADSYGVLLAARLLTSMSHGAFFGVGAVVAAGLVPRERQAAALAAMFSGLTVATIGGVPLAAWLGGVLGWRVSFAGIAGIGLLVMAALRLALPPLPAAPGSNMRGELAVLARRPVLAALVLTVLSSTAMFTVFTYVVPLLRSATDASSMFVTTMLSLYGVGLMAGNWLGGRCADRSVDGTLAGSLVGVIVVLSLFAGLAGSIVAVVPLVFLWGVASFALVAPLQMRVMGEAAGAPVLASAMNIGAFNLGNALGAALGGGVINAGWGYRAVLLAGAGSAVVGLMFMLGLRGMGARGLRRA